MFERLDCRFGRKLTNEFNPEDGMIDPYGDILTAVAGIHKNAHFEQFLDHISRFMYRLQYSIGAEYNWELL